MVVVVVVGRAGTARQGCSMATGWPSRSFYPSDDSREVLLRQLPSCGARPPVYLPPCAALVHRRRGFEPHLSRRGIGVRSEPTPCAWFPRFVGASEQAAATGQASGACRACVAGGLRASLCRSAGRSGRPEVSCSENAESARALEWGGAGPRTLRPGYRGGSGRRSRHLRYGAPSASGDAYLSWILPWSMNS